MRYGYLCGGITQSTITVENVLLALIREGKYLTIILLSLVCACPRGKSRFVSVPNDT